MPYTVSVVSRFSMDNAYNITINSKAVIGNNVYIGPNETIVGGIYSK